MIGEHYELNGSKYITQLARGTCAGCEFVPFSSRCEDMKAKSKNICIEHDLLFAPYNPPSSSTTTIREVMELENAGEVFTKLAKLADSAASAAKLEEGLKEYL